MEALLCLPFLFLILALTVNLGYGWLVRLKAEAGVRLAVSHYVTLTVAGTSSQEAEAEARELVQQAYFRGLEPIELDVRVDYANLSGRIEREGTGVSEEALAPLRRLGRKLSGRTKARLVVPRRVPTRTLLPDTPVVVSYDLDGGTWTHAEIPLTLDAMTGLEGENSLPSGLGWLTGAISWVGEKFFQLLGMEP
jgi:hypothetical protein